MCHVSCVTFVVLNLTKEEVCGKRVLEIGSYNINGGLRPIVESFKPGEYVGIDIAPGPGVDEVCNADNIVSRFGAEAFDVVISTEVLEHVQDWKLVLSNIKRVCKRSGTIILTTRSKGFPYHPTPRDLWRYDANDMKSIFEDCKIMALVSDQEHPGIFIKVQKPEVFVEKDLTAQKLYSMITNSTISELREADSYNLHFARLVLKDTLRRIVKRALKTFGRVFG